MKNMEAIRRTARLPVWLKMFSNSEEEKSNSQIDGQLLDRIAAALSENKAVTLLVNGKPLQFYKDKDGQIKVTSYEDVKYVLK